MSDNVAAQGGHLPECPIGQHPTRFDSCICDRLRACEARVRQRERRLHRLDQDVQAGASYTEGRTAGLDAATEAVAALPATAWHCPDLTFAKAAKAEAVAAIAALKDTP